MICSAWMVGGAVSRREPVCGVITAGGFSGSLAGGGICCWEEEVGGGSGPTCCAAARGGRTDTQKTSAGAARHAKHFFCNGAARDIVLSLEAARLSGVQITTVLDAD